MPRKNLLVIAAYLGLISLALAGSTAPFEFACTGKFITPWKFGGSAIGDNCFLDDTFDKGEQKAKAICKTGSICRIDGIAYVSGGDSIIFKKVFDVEQISPPEENHSKD